VESLIAPSLAADRFNFVGGWLGEGCGDAVVVNRSTFASAAVLDRPGLWLYGTNASCSVSHSRANFDAFAAAGGRARFSCTRAARRAPMVTSCERTGSVAQ
jgi:hypothetical protein